MTLLMRLAQLSFSGWLALALSLCLAAAPALAAPVPSQPCDVAALPRHVDFAVTPQTRLKKAALKRNNRFARKYRTRLDEGLRDLPVNFAGHYVMVTWGCGTTCLDGGMVDARTGEASALPFPLDSFGSFEVDIADPLLTRADSRLVIMLGMLREEDETPRQYFYEWTGGKLKPLCHAIYPRSVR
ncbi:MAG: hypothetical protein K8F90_17775 [Hyphomicrobiales bacterium]|nr:hypothetical protein [Hyphomicrobiales bacterium]